MNTDEVKKIFEENIRHRILESNTSSCNIVDAKTRVDTWKKEGYKVVFTAGVFDIFTINHLLALYHYKLLGGEKVKLVISVDTDARVQASKSFNISKGNSIKPVLSWQNRSLMIAKQTFNLREDLVDLILQHGSDTCDGMVCPHDDNVTIAEVLQPDIIAVTSTSTATIDALAASVLIRDESVTIIKEEELAYNDILLGENISNTAIIKRIRGNV